MATVNEIRTSICEALKGHQNKVAEEIKKLQEYQKCYDEAATAFNELLPFLPKPLSKLHLGLEGVRPFFYESRTYNGTYRGVIKVKALEGFRFLGRTSNSDRDYERLSNKAEKICESLLEALESRGVTYVRVNPYFLQGGEVSDYFELEVVIERK